MSLFETAAAVEPTPPPATPPPPTASAPAAPAVMLVPSTAPKVEFNPKAPLEVVPDPSAAPVKAPPPTYDPTQYGEVDPKTGRPANVPSKYWDYEKREVKWPAVLEQHNWLQKKLGEKREKPPDAYTLTADSDYTPPEDLPKDPVYKGIASYAREHLELSQTQWDGLVRHYMGLMEASGQEIGQAEIASLGPNGVERITALKKVLAANAPPDIYQKAQAGILNAAAVEVLEWAVRESLPPPLERAGSVDSADTDDTLYQLQMAKDEYGQPKMADPAYAASYRKRLASHLATRRR